MTGVQTCALPIYDQRGRDVRFRMAVGNCKRHPAGGGWRRRRGRQLFRLVEPVLQLIDGAMIGGAPGGHGHAAGAIVGNARGPELTALFSGSHEATSCLSGLPPFSHGCCGALKVGKV